MLSSPVARREEVPALRQAATQDVVEAGNARRRPLAESDFTRAIRH